MRAIVLAFLLLGTVAAQADEFVHSPTGLKLDVPEGWTRDYQREKGTVKFAAVFDVAPSKLVYFTVEAAPAAGFGADDWLDAQKAAKKKMLKEISKEFAPDREKRIGDLDAVGFSCAGTRVLRKDHPAVPVRYRVYGVVSGDVFFQFTELSVNGAHEGCAEELKDIWDGISFQAAEGGEGGVGGGLGATEGKPTAVEDKPGNYKATLPPGWVVEREAPLEEDTRLRMVFSRKVDDSTVAVIRVFKVQLNNPRLFHSGTPNDVLQDLSKNWKLFESYYGEGSADAVIPDMDEGIGFGGASKAGGYEIRNITMEEQANIAAAEQKIRKGIKGVEVPKYKPLVIRGRLAMISPNIYVTVVSFARSLADDANLVGEVDKIHESFEFLVTEALPPPLSVMGNEIGDTTKDPANAKARKKEKTRDIKGRKIYRIEYKFVVPEGWAVNMDKGGDRAFMVYAQDARNSWITVVVACVNHKQASEERKEYPKDTQFNTWKSNWTGKARGAKIPSKPQKFALGKARGEGYKLLEGSVNGFDATFSAVLSDKFPGKGWRTFIEVETRGAGHEVFADGLKTFLKSLKAKDIKVK